MTNQMHITPEHIDVLIARMQTYPAGTNKFSWGYGPLMGKTEADVHAMLVAIWRMPPWRGDMAGIDGRKDGT